MFSQGAADVPCTLLHFVNNELVDVAKGKIVQPGNPLFHGTQMPPNVFRVQLVRVLPGCDELLPPIRPVGADDDDVMTLSACLSWPLLWPKSQIRLGAGESAPWQDRRNGAGHPYATGSKHAYGTGSERRRRRYICQRRSVLCRSWVRWRLHGASFSRTQPNKRRARCSWYRGEAKLQQASSAVQLSGDASSCRLHRASDRRGAKYSQPQHTQEGGL